jgi:predicted ATPase
MGFLPPVQKLLIRNLLSFGDDSPEIDLGPLTVLIGPNGSGKSNLIQVIGLLKSAPDDLAAAIRIEDGVSEWLWKGASNTPTATIEAILQCGKWPMALRYRLRFTRSGHRLEITDERIENNDLRPGEARPYFFFGHENGRPVINVNNSPRTLQRDSLNPQLSVLSQRKDPDQYPELTFVGALFQRFQLYRDWEFGGLSDVREPSRADGPDEFLEEDGSNLGIMLAKLQSIPGVNKQLKEYLKRFYVEAEDVHTPIRQSRIEISLEEKFLKSTIPATRLSDGTLRWLALLCIFLNPDPPPLVCVEEPELGMHPDMVPEVGKLLREASTRMQVIVTTHSAELVDSLTDCPESIVVCEKSRGSTVLKRLSKENLSEWLEKYTLGQLWSQGHIGGNRW